MKKILFIGLFSLLSILSARAYDFEVNGIYYNILSGTNAVEVTYKTWSYEICTDYSGSVVIPATVTHNGTTYNVTAIGIEAFGGCSGLTSVTIPNGVTSIGKDAFHNCSGLTSVTIPNGVTSIGQDAFHSCSGLTSVTIPNSVTAIGQSAFWGCSGLTSVTIPENVTSIGREAFLCLSGVLSVYYTGNLVQWCGIEFGENWNYEAYPANVGGKTHYWILYINNVKVTDLVIPDGVTAIGFAFQGCIGLTSVTIPESVTSIGEKAFQDCGGLTSVTIPASVTSIGEYAFESCSNLTSLTIPENVTVIGNFAFEKCYNLKTVTISDGVTSIGNGAFFYCSDLTTVNIPNSVTFIGNRAFCDCSGLRSLTVGEGVTEVGDCAFLNCSSLTSVEWNARYCEDIGLWNNTDDRYTFTGTDIRTLMFGESVEYIPANLFKGCSGIRSVRFPASLTGIGKDAFNGCNALREVYCSSPIPPVCNNDVFSNYGTLYVPQGSKSAYESAPEWYKFTISEEEQGDEDSYTVTLLVNDASLGRVTGGGTYASGTPVTLTAEANAGCRFVRWSDGNTSNPRTVTVNGDLTLTAIFTRAESVSYRVTARVNDASLGGVTQGGVYASGETVPLVAIAYQGSEFVRWNDGNTNNPRLVTVEGDVTLTALFAKNGTNPSAPTDPSIPTDTTANEQAQSAAPFAYVRGRTAYLADGLGEVEALTSTGQRVYRGRDNAILLPRPGAYILRVVADGRRCKVVVK